MQYYVPVKSKDIPLIIHQLAEILYKKTNNTENIEPAILCFENEDNKKDYKVVIKTPTELENTSFFTCVDVYYFKEAECYLISPYSMLVINTSKNYNFEFLYTINAMNVEYTEKYSLYKDEDTVQVHIEIDNPKKISNLNQDINKKECYDILATVGMILEKSNKVRLSIEQIGLDKYLD